MTRTLVAATLAALLATGMAMAQSAPTLSVVAPVPTFTATAPAQASAPVQIVNEAGYKIGSLGRYAACVSFLNASQKLITAVRFEFVLADVFHEKIGAFHGDRIGEFSPGVSIDGPADQGEFNVVVNGGTWKGANRKAFNCWTYYVSGTPQSMQATVSHVLFADGTEWKVAAPAIASPVQTAAPILNVIPPDAEASLRP